MTMSLRSPLLGLLLVVLAVYGIERLIVTDAEKIEQLGEDAAHAIRAEAWEWLENLLHEEFTYENRDRAQTVEHIRSLVRKYKPTDVGVAIFEIQVDDAEAKARAVVKGTALGRPVRVPVDAWFKEVDDDWKLWKVQGGAWVR
ncbi:MAG: hypothetical protein QNJ90_03460 [Planctomycetota bacterium]|nr:hypothetical protein [Planctomycetota bacterium]